ncbi:glycosyl transferase [Erwinia sp. OLTSP20]|uniref:glycosyltransferase n=1 Tax=unclassified Erwinia TaxID=2622719 RepID=UPI000C17ECDE|nr:MULTISPECIES: glycosyltransferase [unclassified Erwinia]PIJ49686.1 glycosyl transferase [Erwinia sp. OAMSP11]PIJ70100.1 glycosyl transferase [Erwinia sp. OLSSP12]PIJ80597.1 glycosyl transferase [Erwinia sp. OLCASP19]PIJ82762.1 glycosyl transferase [Erwinia sp. OLMTSP26]PIJ84840.1 glycosyl transferase [Erwinia sp. OLMDSP33]
MTGWQFEVLILSRSILLIIDGLPGGGAEKVVLTLAEGLVNAGHRVAIFSLRNVCEYPLPAGVEYQVIADRCRRPWRKLTELRRRAALLDKAIRHYQTQQGECDLVLSNLHKTDRIVSRCRSIAGAKTWYCLHGVFSASYLGGKTGFSRWLKRWKIRRVYQGRQVIGVSQYVVDDLVNRIGVTPRVAKVIANPFDFRKIHQLAEAPCALAGTDYLLHVGRFHPAKRHDRLLEAYALSGIQAPLVLLGQGDDGAQQRLRQLAESLAISERVQFAGFQANPYPWIKHARLLIVSSDSEGFGNVLIEALCCNTPVVSTRCPGGPASILTGELSRGLAELNAKSLGKKIEEIYHNPPPAQATRLESYSLPVICQQYLQLADKR